MTLILLQSSRRGLRGNDILGGSHDAVTQYNSRVENVIPLPLSSRRLTGEHHACLFSSRLEAPHPWLSGWKQSALDVFAIIVWVFVFVLFGLAVMASLLGVVGKLFGLL